MSQTNELKQPGATPSNGSAGTNGRTRRAKKPDDTFRPERPAMVFEEGTTVTRVWANRSAWGVPDWRIDQIRVYPRGGEFGMTRSLAPRDVKDALRGLYKAGQWVKRQSRPAWGRPRA